MMIARTHLSTSLRLAALLLLTGALGCHSCSLGSGKPAEQYVEKSAQGIIVIPSLGELADHSQGLIESARSAPGGANLVKVSADLARKLGFDPLTRDGQKSAGLDSSRSLAISGVARSEMLMVLPYRDLSTLDATVTRLFKDFGNLPARKTVTKNGFSVVTYASSDSAPPLFAYATAGNNMLLAAGADPVGLAIAAASRTPDASLVQQPQYVAAKARVGARDVFVYNFSPERPLPVAIPPQTMFGLSFGAKEVALRINTPLSPEKAKRAAEFFGQGETSLGELPAGQPIYIRGDIDWAKVIAAVEPHLKPGNLAVTGATVPVGQDPMAEARAFFREVDIDLDSELIGNILPGFSVTIGIAPTADLSNAFIFDPRRANPFNNYTVAGIGHVKDPGKATTTLAKLSKLAEKLGATVATKEVAGGTVYTASYQLGEGLSWTLRGNEVLVAGGYGDKLPALISALSSHQQTLKSDQFPPRTRDMLFATQGVAIALDLGKIDEAVKNIHTGSGLQQAGAEMVRSAMSNVLHQLSALRPALAITPVDDGINVDFAVSLQ